MPKLKLGAVVYGLVALSSTVQVVVMLRHDGQWREVHGWVFAALLSIVVLSTLVLAVGAVTRRGLIADDGPWICQNGWIVLVVLTAAAFAVVIAGGVDTTPWPTLSAIFLPHWIRRAQESYCEGVAEAEVEIRAGRDGETPSGW